MVEVQYGVRYRGWEQPCKDREEALRMLQEDTGIKLIAREVVYGEWCEIAEVSV
jgi:hypothetical protein